MADKSVNNVQYEMNAIKFLMDSKSPEVFASLRLDLFGTRDLANIFRLTSLHFAEHGEIMGWDTLVSEIQSRVPDKKKADFLSEMVVDIKGRDLSGLKFEQVKKKLEEHRKLRAALGKTESLINAVEVQDVSTLEAELQALYDEIFMESSNFLEVDQFDMVNMAGNQVKFNFRKTGIEGLDRRGGLIEGGYTVIGAPAKAGKSTLAVQFALHGHDNYDGSTAVFSFEQGRGELRSRILSKRSNLDLGMIMSDMLKEDERVLLRIAEVDQLCHLNDNMRDFCHENAKVEETEFWASFWDHFQPRDNRFMLIDTGPDWDSLFTQMELLAKLKGVKVFVIDYPYLVPRGRTESHLQSWEYNLAMSKKLKSFARRHGCWVICPAQFDDKEDSLKYVKGVVNDVDLFLKLRQYDEDKDMGEAGAVTCEFGAYRNFLSIPGEPQLKSFKMMKAFHISQFIYFEY